MRLAGTLVLSGLGAWLASSTVAALAGTQDVLGLVLAPPGPGMVAAAVAVAAFSHVRKSVWPVLAPLLIAALPLTAPWVPAVWVYAGEGAAVIWMSVALGGIWAGHQRDATLTPVWWQAVSAIVIGAVWLGGIAGSVRPVAMTGDAPHYLTITQSLLEDGDVDLKNNYDAHTYRAFYQGSLEPRHTNASPWGEDYSFHGPGVSVLVAPGMAAYGAAGATVTLVLLLALGGGLLWCAAWELTRDTGAAWFGWGALVASAPYALHAAAIYPDGPAAVAVAAALWLLARLQGRQPVPLWALAAGSVGLAALPWLHVRLALPAGVFGLAILASVLSHQPDRWTRASWFLMIPIPSAAGWLASASVMFGTWNPARAMLQRTAPSHWDAAPAGLLGLLADREYGLFPAAPVMLAVLLAYPAFVRAFPLIGASTGAAVAAVLGMSSLWVWWGGTAAPARFLVVILPALALWLAHLWSRTGPPIRRVFSIALVMTATMTVLYATVDGGGRAYNFPDGRGSIFAGFSHSVDVAQALPSLLQTGATAATELPVALLWLAAVVLVSLTITVIPARRGEGAAWAIGSLVVAAGMATCTGFAWRVRGAEGWTPGSAAHTLLRALAVPSVGVAAGWPPSPQQGARLEGRLRVITPESLTLEPPTLLHVPNVPAGDYRVHATPRMGAAAGTTLSLELGRDAWSFATWPPSAPPPTFLLLASLHSVRVTGAAADVWLEPVALRPSASPSEARRVTRMGNLLVYSMDDNCYVERMGAWIGGNRAAEFLVSGLDTTEVSTRLEAGPAAVNLRVEGSVKDRVVRLEPHASAVMMLGTATSSDAIRLRVTVEGGFPASQLGDPGDSRILGAWITFDAPPRR